VVPQPNGRVVKILSITAGLADLDTTERRAGQRRGPHGAGDHER